jgi:hypothetical protein
VQKHVIGRREIPQLHHDAQMVDGTVKSKLIAKTGGFKFSDLR